MKVLLFIALLFSIINISGYGQFGKEQKMSGVIFLIEDSPVVGPLIYLEKEQVLLVENMQKMSAYSTFHVDSFYFYDPKMFVKRKFKKLTYHGRAYFFEIVVTGKLEILRLRKFSAPLRTEIRSELDQHRLDYTYYVLDDEKLYFLTSYNHSKIKKKYPQLWEEIRQYIIEQNFFFYRPDHKVQIIQKTNELLINQ